MREIDPIIFSILDEFEEFAKHSAFFKCFLIEIILGLTFKFISYSRLRGCKGFTLENGILRFYLPYAR